MLQAGEFQFSRKVVSSREPGLNALLPNILIEKKL